MHVRQHVLPPDEQTAPLDLPGGSAHFITLPTSVLKDCIDLVAELAADGAPVHTTGGGAVKYTAELSRQTSLHIGQPRDEMESMIAGLECVLGAGAVGAPSRGNGAEAFSLDPGDPLKPCSPVRAASLERLWLPAQERRPWPYLFASLGSGLSVVHVTGPAPAERARVGGSSIAGGSLWSLAQLLLAQPARGGDGRALVEGYDDLLQLAEAGNCANVDLTVGDIYGGNGCKAIGLDASVPAASLGKAARMPPPPPSAFFRGRTDHSHGEAEQCPQPHARSEPDNHRGSSDHERQQRAASAGARAPDSAPWRPADVAQSLVWMVAWNAAQLAALDARRLGVRTVYFGGNLCRGRPYPMATISNSVRFNSAGEARAVFLRREGSLGSLGALLSSHG